MSPARNQPSKDPPNFIFSSSPMRNTGYVHIHMVPQRVFEYFHRWSKRFEKSSDCLSKRPQLLCKQKCAIRLQRLAGKASFRFCFIVPLCIALSTKATWPRVGGDRVIWLDRHILKRVDTRGVI